jgi:hypothetical protein
LQARLLSAGVQSFKNSHHDSSPINTREIAYLFGKPQQSRTITDVSPDDNPPAEIPRHSLSFAPSTTALRLGAFPMGSKLTNIHHLLLIFGHSVLPYPAGFRCPE